jgi:polar amino acid transport system substrate-binding protein
MKQVAQYVRSGSVVVVDVPPPAVGAGQVLVRVHASVISVGTERTSVVERSQSLLTKARKNPELVARVFEQVRQQGLGATVRRVRGRLESWTPLGYSAAGVVEEVGRSVAGIAPGDRVACAGAGYASHAEWIAVPKNLCVRVPDGVSFVDAAYTTIGAIALQGVRQAEPNLGDVVAVIGLGLVGLLTVQLLKANGCVVIGIDPDTEAVKRARQLGADAAIARQDDVKRLVGSHSGHLGADAVLITAATKSDDPVRLAGDIARDRARVVLVGDVGLQLPRGPYYMKELDFRLSRSYGPGRYDPSYEEEGRDYPAGYVRWTERRNMEEFLRLVKGGAVTPGLLTTHRYAIDAAAEAYALLAGPSKGRSARPFGVVLEYPVASSPEKKTKGARRTSAKRSDPLAIGLIGAGSFAQSMLVPPLQQQKGVRLLGVCNATGMSSRNVASQFGIRTAMSSVEELLGDAEIGTVVIASRHGAHGAQVLAALKAGKNVFVEKPLSMLPDELDEIEAFVRSLPEGRRPLLMVGFNRRFAPSIDDVRAFFVDVVSPISVLYRVNAGHVPLTHWTRSQTEGGGRVVGEVCHFVDLAACLAGSGPVRVHAEAVGADRSTSEDDSLVATLRFANGSTASIAYLANGDPSVPKEHIFMSGGGRTAVVDNFQAVTLTSGGSSRRKERATVDKGHRAEIAAFVDALRKGGPAPIPFESLVRTMRATFLLEESIRRGVSIDL